MRDKFTGIYLMFQFHKLNIEGANEFSFGGGGAGTATLPATNTGAEQVQPQPSSAPPPVTPPVTQPTGTTPPAGTIPTDPSQAITPPVQVNPEVAKMFAPYADKQHVVTTAINVFAPYYAGQSNTRETVNKMFDADAGLASELFFQMVRDFSKNEYYIKELASNKDLVHALATQAGYQKTGQGTQPQTQPNQQAATNTQTAYQPPVAGINPASINVVDPLTGLPDPEKVALVQTLTAMQSQLGEVQGQLSTFQNQGVEQQVAAIFTQAKSEGEKFVTGELDKLVKLEGPHAGIKTFLTEMIGNRIDGDTEATRLFNSYVTNQYNRNGVSANNDLRAFNGRVSEIVKRTLGEVGPSILAGNAQLLAQVNAQAGLRQPGQPGASSGLPQSASPAQQQSGGDIVSRLNSRVMANFERNRQAS